MGLTAEGVGRRVVADDGRTFSRAALVLCSPARDDAMQRTRNASLEVHRDAWKAEHARLGPAGVRAGPKRDQRAAESRRDRRRLGWIRRSARSGTCGCTGGPSRRWIGSWRCQCRMEDQGRKAGRSRHERILDAVSEHRRTGEGNWILRKAHGVHEIHVLCVRDRTERKQTKGESHSEAFAAKARPYEPEYGTANRTVLTCLRPKPLPANERLPRGTCGARGQSWKGGGRCSHPQRAQA